MRVDLAPTLRASLRARVPDGFRNRPNRPLLMVVHATRSYDRSGSVEYPINKTIDRLCPDLNLLEIEEKRGPSYLALPQGLRTSREYAGTLLHRSFFDKFAELIESTNTFIFIGGRANRCLTNAFLSVLIAKITPLERLFANRESILNVQMELPGLLRQALTAAGPTLNFHFYSGAIYPSHSDLKMVSRRSEYLDWSPNIPYIVTASMGAKNQRLLARSGLVLVNHVDGITLDKVNGSSDRQVNLFYWHSLVQLAEHFTAAGFLANGQA
ncbi:MAG: hypothetical protein JW782_04210 [Candidatus Saganbacteria bacterium]|nr:hypothetical protein [Candidatus Saganbacteria bacterium]